MPHRKLLKSAPVRRNRTCALSYTYVLEKPTFPPRKPRISRDRSHFRHDSGSHPIDKGPLFYLLCVCVKSSIEGVSTLEIFACLCARGNVKVDRNYRSIGRYRAVVLRMGKFGCERFSFLRMLDFDRNGKLDKLEYYVGVFSRIVFFSWKWNVYFNFFFHRL